MSTNDTMNGGNNRRRRIERYGEAEGREPSMAPPTEKPGRERSRAAARHASPLEHGGEGFDDSRQVPQWQNAANLPEGYYIPNDGQPHQPNQPQQPNSGYQGWTPPPQPNAGQENPYVPLNGGNLYSPSAETPTWLKGNRGTPNGQPPYPYGMQQPYGQPQPYQNGSYQGTPYQTNPYPPVGVQQFQAQSYQPAPPPFGQHTGGFHPAVNQRKGLQRKDVMKLALLAAVIVLLVVSIVYAVRSANRNSEMRATVSRYDNLFVPGVYVDGIHLGGMTRQEALNAVQSQAQQRSNAWNVRLEIESDGSRQLVGMLTAADLGLTVDVTGALEEAWQQGHASADLNERKAEMDRLAKEPYYGATAKPSSGNTAVVDQFLANIASAAYYPATDAFIEKFDPAMTNPFTIRQETWGRMLDTAPIKEEILQMLAELRSGSILIKTTDVMPNITKADVEKKVARRGMAYTPISTTSTENRNKNIKRASELISGTVITPGSTFSFNGVVGKRSAANGFYEAIEYAYSEERLGYGGGICQVSSTIYIAAVRAGLEIVKREQHSDKVNYTEYGLDATVNLDGRVIDLVFKNNTSSNIYIVARVQRDPKIDSKHDIVRIDVYGEALPNGVTYDLVAKTVEVLPPPEEIEYVNDKNSEHVMYIDEMVQKRKASEGYKVESYRITKLDGVEIERTLLYVDTYHAKSAQMWVGVKER